jgi:hypothetical protein
MSEFERMSEYERQEWFTDAVRQANAGMTLNEESRQAWENFVDDLRLRLISD